MPRVEGYGGQKVPTAPLPSARKQAHETFESQGGPIGQAQAGFGDVVYRESMQTLGAMQERAAQVQYLTADRQLLELDHELVTDPEKGALRVRGLEALGSNKRVLEQFDKRAGEIELAIVSSPAKQAFRRARDHRRTSIVGRLNAHGMRELEQHSVREAEASLEMSVQHGIANAQDLPSVAEAVGRLEAAAAHVADARGLGPEARAALLSEKRTALHAGVIERLLVNDQDRNARVYLEEVRDQIAGPALAELERRVDVASTAATGLRAAEALWSEHGPQSDADPIHLDRMESAARAQFANDPKTLDATIRYLRERKVGVDASRKDREEATAGALWSVVAQGGSLEQLRRMPQYLAAPARLQLQVTTELLRRDEHKANRAYLDESRAFTRTQRAEQERERQGVGMYWHYSRPDVLAQMSDHQVLALIPDLGVDHVNRLLATKRELGRSELTVREATVDREVLDHVLRAAGVDPSDSSDRAKSRRGELLMRVEDAIDAEQRARKRKLTRDETRQITQAIVDRRVMVDVYGSDEERIAATVVDPSDRANAYVPIARIPAPVLSQYLNYARGLSATLQRLPDAELRARFADRIQRAYALRLLGGTRAEIEAAMRGQEE